VGVMIWIGISELRDASTRFDDSVSQYDSRS
jgi:hypothetical protein